jgi:DNA repair protein RadC
MRDTNPIAHRLLATFGSLEEVFSASKEELMQIEGVKEKTAELLLSVGKIGEYPFFCKSNTTKYDSHIALGRFFCDFYRGNTKRETYMMMLTNSMEMIAIEKIADGDFIRCHNTIGALITSVLKRSASVVVLAHNHPNGPLYETQEEHFTYAFLKNAFDTVGIVYIENYIISGEGFCSTVGKIDTLNFQQSPEIEQFIKEKENSPDVYVAMRP